MASIVKRKSKYSVVYFYQDENGNRRQKWETFNTNAEAKKRKKQVAVTDDATGETVYKDVTEAELVKLRLARARALDEEKYKDERTVPLSALSDGKE